MWNTITFPYYQRNSLLKKVLVKGRSSVRSSILPQLPPTGNITINPLFVTLLHKAIREALASSPELHEEGKRKINGLIYIIDGRAQGSEHVEAKYIAGAFPVKNGVVMTESYVPGPNYELIDEKGSFELPDVVMEYLMKELS